MSRFKHIIDDPNTKTNYNTLTYQSTPYSFPQQNISQPYFSWPSVFPKGIIGLEYDGVINIENSMQWIAIEGSLEAIRMMRLKGYKVVILSDQGGITRGEKTHEQVEAMHNYAMQKFGEAGIFSIDGFFYAESDIKEDIFAKPNIGMFERAEREIYSGSTRFKNGGFYVGHRMKDLKAGLRAGATPILVRTGQGRQTEEDIQRFSAEKIRKKTKVFNNLLQFAQSLK
jgi:HAD superfamily hydrolase (TIGR01662 family)